MNGQEPKMVIIVVVYIYLVLHTHVFISTYPNNDFTYYNEKVQLSRTSCYIPMLEEPCLRNTAFPEVFPAVYLHSIYLCGKDRKITELG